MVVIRALLWKQFLQRIRLAITWKWAQASLTIRSLTYNEHMSYNYFVDCMLEPLIWVVDNYSKCLGKVFVFCVSILTSAVVAIAYWVGLPYWWERSPYAAVALVIFGNWLLLNIVFHYYMGVVTSPGYPPDASIIPQAAGICKKCITPKPARTHHCSVCDRCILAMDHHCPWLNNCVGYYNARYFYLYMVYMVAGVTFVILAGFNIGYVALWLNDNGGLTSHDDPELIGHPVKINKSGVYIPVKGIVEYDIDNQPREHNLPVPLVTEAQRITADPWKRRAVLFMAVTCIAVLIALGVLSRMHAKQISRGETSIESHVNVKMRSKGNFRNPYDFGTVKNWRLFLGLTNGRSFWRHVLLPSAHRPCGDGVTWHTVDRRRGDWP